MKFKGFNLYIILLSVVIIMILYFGITHFYQIYNVNTPLKDGIAKIKGVELLNIKNGDEYTVNIKLNKSKNLFKTYYQVENILNNIIRDKNTNILIKENYSENLENIYSNIHPYLYEGAATKDYTKMIKNIDKLLKNQNYNLWVDNKRIYFQMNIKDENLYKVIPVLRSENNG